MGGQNWGATSSHGYRLQGQRPGGGEAEEVLHFELPGAFGVSGEAAPEVFGFGEFSLLLVALGFDDAQNQRFQLSEMAVADCEIDAEPIPGLGVAIFQVVAQTGAEIGCEADVVELAPAVESVNAVAIADVLADEVLVLFQGLPGNVFQVLTD
jgi:hypothetical protein